MNKIIEMFKTGIKRRKQKKLAKDEVETLMDVLYSALQEQCNYLNERNAELNKIIEGTELILDGLNKDAGSNVINVDFTLTLSDI